MKKLLLLGVAAVALTAAIPAQAQSTFTGECGLVRTMDAKVLPPMTLAVAADYVGSEDTFVPVRAEMGIIQGLEIGGNYWFVDTEGIDNYFGFNAKYRLPLQFVEGLGIAAGVNYQVRSNEEVDDWTKLTVTGVVSYDIPAGAMTLTPSAGVSWETVDYSETDEDGVRFFASLMAMVMPNLGVGGEIVSSVDDLDGDDADPSMWFGARFTPVQNLSVQAGMLNNANLGDDLEDWVFHVGAGYVFAFGM